MSNNVQEVSCGCPGACWGRAGGVQGACRGQAKEYDAMHVYACGVMEGGGGRGGREGVEFRNTGMYINKEVIEVTERVCKLALL